MTCNYPTCNRERGTQDRDDYSRKFCSVQCEVLYNKRKQDAKEARLAEQDAESETIRGP